jgi:hypothetical protein
MDGLELSRLSGGTKNSSKEGWNKIIIFFFYIFLCNIFLLYIQKS